MRKIAMWLAVALTCAAGAQGQAAGTDGRETSGALLFSYEAHPGQRAAFDEGYRRHLEWHRTNADSLLWYGWDVLAGDRLGSFVDGTFGSPFAALDARVDPAGDAADAAETFQPHAEATGRELVLLRPDLGTATPLEDASPPPFVQVVRYRVAPGDIAFLESALESVRESAGGSSLPYTVYEAVAGAEPGFLLMIWRDRLGTFDEVAADPARAVHRRVSEAAADAAARPDIRAASEVWRYRSDLSYLGAEGENP